jgi:hypothetical protein
VNFVSKFIPNSSDVLHPLNNLLKKDVPWNWSNTQEDAFNQVKKMICNSTTLSYYDPSKELVLENDASDYGLGSALMQDGKPIAFASRSLSSSEKNYAQIEKEMLAIVYGLNKFHHYVYGREVIVYTDHKPLVNINQKALSKAPKRLQSLMLKIQDYTFKLIYKPGNSIPVADALSRAPADKSEHVNVLSNASNLPIKEEKLEEIRRATEEDSTMSDLKHIIAKGWPSDKSGLPHHVSQFFYYRDELTIEDGIVYRGERIVVPKSLQDTMKQKVHAGHTGINSCLRRARTYIFWPGMSSEIRQYVENCSTCASLQPKQQQEPLKLHEVPDRPWQKVGTDLLTLNSRNYLITVDYYSQYFEVDFLQETTSEAIIHKLKSNFARHGIPNVIISDNGPQYSSQEFNTFCTKWDITHETISPGNSRANGAAEAAVKVAKRMMKKCNLNKEDPYIALLNLRNTPQEGSVYSPAQRLMGRRTRTLLPTSPKLLKPAYTQDHKAIKVNHQAKVAEKGARFKELKPLQVNDSVRIQPINPAQEIWKPATVTRQVNPRSYIVTTENGRQLRRNRVQLRLQKDTPKPPTQSRPPPEPEPRSPHQSAAPTRPETNPPVCTNSENSTEPSSPTVTTTRSGRTIRKPVKYQ